MINHDKYRSRYGMYQYSFDTYVNGAGPFDANVCKSPPQFCGGLGGSPSEKFGIVAIAAAMPFLWSFLAKVQEYF